MCNSTRISIGNGVPQWEDTNYYTCRKHNGASVVDYLLLFKENMCYVQCFTIGAWCMKFNHRTLLVDNFQEKINEHVENGSQMGKRPPYMSFKHAPMYASTVVNVILKALYTLVPLASLEKQWEAFKEAICNCVKACFATKSKYVGHTHICSACKGWFETDCRKSPLDHT